MYDPEYDAIVTQLRGTFYPRPFTDTANLDLAGYAIGATPIGPNWLKARRTFNSTAAAEDFLRALIPEQAHPREHDPGGGQALAPYKTRIAALAADLIAGTRWCLPVYPQSIACPGLVTQAAGQHMLTAAQMSAINGQLGTNVDLVFISTEEGFQWLRGYAVLRGKQHINVGRSGLTITSGFDIGQQGPAELTRMGLNAEITALLTPYLGVKFINPVAHHAPHHPAYTDMTGEEVARTIANTGPIPVLTKAQADEVDRCSFTDKIRATQRAWDAAHHARPHAPHQHHGHGHAAAPPAAPAAQPAAGQPGAPPAVTLKAFTALSGAWQTVLVDWVYQFGPGVFRSQTFARSALAGDAATAKTQLRAQTDTRRQKESRLLTNDTTTLVVAPAAPARPTPAAAPMPAAR